MAIVDAPTIEDTAADVLGVLAGPDAQLRPGQMEALHALRRPGARVLVVQATGWGKSAVYWIATSWIRRAGGGPTLVVSPLLSLMRDQVAAAERAGLRAATLNSSNFDAWQQIEDDLAAGEIDVLLVSPERLANPGFGARVLESLAGSLGLVVIDEAHSVSDWGHDFRPDYRRVTDVLRRLNPQTPVLATTATANSRVVADVAEQFGDDTVVLRGPLARSSLQLAVLPLMDPLQRYAWVVDHLPELPGSGIVYTLTVADAERLTEALQRRYADTPGMTVAAYTGGLDSAQRERLEEDLRANRVKALVATSALGMGYDKPDLGFVVHVGAPPSPVSYYQQVGRAGRAIDHALVALLPSAGDDAVWDYFATATIPKEPQVRRLLEVLSAAEAPMSVPALEAETGLRRSKVELLLKQLAVDGVTERLPDGWRVTGTTWEFDQAHYDSVLAVRRREADIMRSYLRGEQCLMQLLQQSLDDPEAEPCGRCSVCLGALPAPLGAAPDPQTVAAVREVLRGEEHLLEPRKMWPGGSFGARGKIPAALAADEGRVIVHADAAEWGDLLTGALRADAAPPQDLLDAAVQTLSRWRNQWSTRPDVIVGLAATGHPQLVAGVVEHLGTVGRLPTAGWAVEARVPDDLTSPDEAAFWRKTLGENAAPDVAGKAVLLVVDESSSGWAVTVAAATLREAGARAVLPLLLHRTVG
ncbi:RecQ family ATP-dependent DNA helicase [Flexivirga sp. ID2601S]|uniref:DNA 3'-5' helicase n=1 Tax=Flexivirga aerilata TaxID=1656889 RepID=A0A849ALR3_9MICO|nr:RecQ family ATP-dependent DNA helicase [Flexivirga aerilata]NNG41063.1 RecQ family ATP-dependent DNA helicase [Flexivirga aerilata]